MGVELPASRPACTATDPTSTHVPVTGAVRSPGSADLSGAELLRTIPTATSETTSPRAQSHNPPDQLPARGHVAVTTG